jgi:beta-galactosidase GanA
MHPKTQTVLAILLILIGGTCRAADDSLPHLRRQGTATQLLVDGQPFLIRGGELENSSGEPDYLRPFWPKLKALNLNTVVAPVYWGLVEPAEGSFDFSSLDGLLQDARANNLHLVLLWFGVWKNSMSCYAPGWVKSDSQRFPRSHDSAGKALEILSPFSAENRAVDAKAFRALLRHVHEVDGKERTVLMVQVENEIGMIPEARDHSAEAERLFGRPVPAALPDYLTKHADQLAPELRERWLANGRKVSGTWTEVFGSGPGAEEIFMAWHFAQFVDDVAAQGKAEHALPMYVNAALIRPGHLPGQYPSAGPLPHLMDVWRAGAPNLDFLAPDIYFANFTEWARKYTRSGNPLFIPEAQRSSEAAVNALYAFGELDAIGFSPFGIESIAEPATRFVTDSYGLVAQLTPLILEHQGNGTMAGLLSEGPEQRQPQQVWLGAYTIHVSFERGSPPALADGMVATPVLPPTPAGGLVIMTGPDEYVFAGTGITATFELRQPGGPQVGLLSVEEGRYVDGQWSHIRWLSGDQTHQGRHMRIGPGQFNIQRVKLYQYR